MKFIKSCVFSVMIALCIVRAVFAEPATMQVNAKAAVLMEPYTGTVLLEQNAHEKLPPASVTKVMTILLIYEAVDNLKIKWDDLVTVSSHAASMGGSQIFLEPLEQQPVRELTKSIVVASANDAAVAMAEYIAGSEEGFVTMMNNRAKELGMENTHFKNACGLDTEGHLTTAYDIALMSRELITKFPEVFNYSGIWMDSIVHKTARGEEVFGLTNTNKLIRSYQGATGLKTGSTSQALYCISATAKRDDLNLIAVVMAAPDPATRFDEARKMFDYGFAGMAIVKGEPANTVKGTIKVLNGEEEQVNVVIKEEVNVLIPKGKNSELESQVSIPAAINAPVKAGTKAGEVVYFFDGKEVSRTDLVVEAPVDKASLGTVCKRLLKSWI